MTKDEGCPTCGSNDIGNLEVKKNLDKTPIWKKQCYNCKKLWHSHSQN
ncbi:MAG TPA: hypothetical protein VMW55_02995 [Nitrosopumilaceae archaeon]|nr:hypothetical protein [Nitrosopumilaceae archaeon]